MQTYFHVMANTLNIQTKNYCLDWAEIRISFPSFLIFCTVKSRCISSQKDDLNHQKKCFKTLHTILHCIVYGVALYQETKLKRPS